MIIEEGPRDDTHIGWDESRGGHWFVAKRVRWMGSAEELERQCEKSAA